MKPELKLMQEIERAQDEVLLWVDLETTGLKPEDGDHVLEIAALFTDMSLVTIPGIYRKVYYSEYLHPVAAKYVIPPRVMEMHTKNGLFAEIAAQMGALTFQMDEQDFLRWMRKTVPADVKVTMAGSSVHFDRRFIREYWPEVDKKLNYQLLDVRAFEYGWRACGQDVQPERPTNHRALGDIIDALTKMRNYRRRLLCR